MRHAVATFLVLSACSFSEIDHPFGSLFDPLIAVGVATVIEPPEDERLDLSKLDLEPGVAITVFLGQSDGEMIPGEEFTTSGCGGQTALPGNGDGSYTLFPPSQHDDCEGPFVITRLDDETPTVLPVTIPNPLPITVPGDWNAGDDMDLDLGAANIDAAIITISDAQNGALVWTNEPKNSEQWHEILIGEIDTTAVVVPGAIFERNTIYALSVTGLVRGSSQDITGANTAVSMVAGGRTYLFAVSTFPAP